MSLLKQQLDQWLEQVDLAAHLTADPLRFPRQYDAPLDQEVVALFASVLAYGRADLIGRALTDVCLRVGTSPAAAAMADSKTVALRRFDGFVYRLSRGVDLSRLWLGVGAVLRAHGSLGAAFAAGDPVDAPDLRPALSAFRWLLINATPDFEERRGFLHLLPDAAKGSAAKRWCMFLRWMVRGPDGVDLGLWTDRGAHRLTMPLDTHVHRIGRYLGLTQRKSADWKTATQITDALRVLAPKDPLRYDFAIAHLGISGACPKRRVAAICVDCPIQAVCTLE